MELPTPTYLNQLARDAGSLALYYFRQADTAVETKADRSIVTAADRAVEDLIRQRLERDFPTHGLLGEEGAADRLDGDGPLWVVDPIDGTSNFANGMATWCVSIGVVAERRPVLGAIYVPLTGDLYHVDDEGRARWNDRPIAVAPPAQRDRDALHLTTNQHKHLALRWPGRTLCLGAVALDLCQVARGAAQGVVMRPHLWDVAGAAAVLLAAGGRLAWLDESRAFDFAQLLEHPARRAPAYMAAGGSDATIALIRETTECLWRPAP